jgi:A/G-specific adenine glycosylase
MLEHSRFRKQLLGWFAQFQRELPWRRDKDPYRVWLSEIMLQQTRVAAVIPYYQRFLEQFPNIQALADAPEEKVLRYWSGLGYYSRARNLQAAAREIVGKHDGKFPETFSDALALPGIGNYTAAAILSIAYNKKLAAVDGNVARVLARQGAVRGDPRESSRWQSLQKTASSLLDPASPGNWNQAMMELGATICTPRAPHCLLCPVAHFCQARKLGISEILPDKRKKRASVEIILGATVFLDFHGRTILLPPPQNEKSASRKENIAALVSRMWHFPTIQIRKNAVLELRKHFGAFPSQKTKIAPQFEALSPARHAVTYRKILLQPFLLRIDKLPEYPDAKIVKITNLDSLPVSSLTRKVARAANDFLASGDFQTVS